MGEGNPRCHRCGTELRTETVKVPAYADLQRIDGTTEKVITHYEDREEVSDCVRCTGSY